MKMRPATPEERRRFYREEWTRREVPDFILRTLPLREFAFDVDGTGPNNRYNQFETVEQLENYLRDRAPFAAYASVAHYQRPADREGWMGAELAFDIDAKDLPLKTCGCQGAAVCERCLDEARRVAAEFGDALRDDLGLANVSFVYSGRGFHIRVNDASAMNLGGSERGQVVKYLTGGSLPGDVTMVGGYPRIFRSRAARAFDRLCERGFQDAEGLRKPLVAKLIAGRQAALGMIRQGRLKDLTGGMGEKSREQLLEIITRANAALTDGKVTIDIKRILRLPSSLHSGVSMKCLLIKDIDRFRLDDAVPRFVREGAR